MRRFSELTHTHTRDNSHERILSIYIQRNVKALTVTTRESLSDVEGRKNSTFSLSLSIAMYHTVYIL